jgi:NAD(P)-dependent dehydrogenase (short-subunit alcohol dehydrogenase family)
MSALRVRRKKAALSKVGTRTKAQSRGVRVNVISPGYTLTAMNKRPEVAAAASMRHRQ